MKVGVKAQKRPVVVDAMQWTGKNAGELKAWMMTLIVEDVDVDEATRRELRRTLPAASTALFVKRRQTGMTETLFRNLIPDPAKSCTAALWVAANESYLPLVDGEWVIHDAIGFYPCQQAVFDLTYDVLPADGR